MEAPWEVPPLDQTQYSIQYVSRCRLQEHLCGVIQERMQFCGERFCTIILRDHFSLGPSHFIFPLLSLSYNSHPSLVVFVRTEDFAAGRSHCRQLGNLQFPSTSVLFSITLYFIESSKVHCNMASF